MTVTNAGPSNVTGATITDVIGSQLTDVTYTATQTGGASGFSATGSGNIDDNTVNMPDRQHDHLPGHRRGQPDRKRHPDRHGYGHRSVGASDPNTSNNVATDTETITNNNADLQVTNDQPDVQPACAAGTSVTYTIVVSDAGPADVTGATVADTFPASLTGVTWTVTSSGGGPIPRMPPTAPATSTTR